MKLYVGGLPYKMNSEALNALFVEGGFTPTKADVVEDKFSGQSRGFGFVEFADDAMATAAIEKFNGHNLEGRTLTVNEARPREEGGARPGGGNRGGFGGGQGGYGGGQGGGNRGGFGGGQGGYGGGQGGGRY